MVYLILQKVFLLIFFFIIYNFTNFLAVDSVDDAINDTFETAKRYLNSTVETFSKVLAQGMLYFYFILLI